jgi:hypothetical protein
MAAGNFNHASTGFPFTGAHAGASCLECRRRLLRNPSQCFACHQSDYNGTNDPDHGSAGFPTTCENCHSTTAWEPSSFKSLDLLSDHFGEPSAPLRLLPRESGQLRRLRVHLCHEHSQNQTNNDHSEVGGYIYQSQACYQCHPQGRD